MAHWSVGSDPVMEKESYTRKEVLLCEMARKDAEDQCAKLKFSKALTSYSQVREDLRNEEEIFHNSSLLTGLNS